MYSRYEFLKIEKEAQDFWATNNSFYVDTNDTTQPFYYCLSMFPYPSGTLHMGHMRNYTLGDFISRYKRMEGYRVLQPMGWDAFGLPAENASIQHSCDPLSWTLTNVVQMKSSLMSMGFGYDWTKEIYTCKPEYYKHQQWFFIQLFKRQLAYRKASWVWFDPVDKTVLANEQVIDGRGWRSGAVVEKRMLFQWFIKATHYADELYEDLKTCSEWPLSLIRAQEMWIRKSEGYEIEYKIVKPEDNYTLLQLAEKFQSIKVFTTSDESLLYVQAVIISPGHPISISLASINPLIDDFIKAAKIVSEKTSVDEASLDMNSGIEVYHPSSKLKIPVWISNIVQDEYATGAMHLANQLEKDQLFSAKNKLTQQHHPDVYPVVMERAVHYRLRDWGVSRQRYWGCPIPFIHCALCGPVPEKEENLPVLLDTEPNTTCPQCGRDAFREQDTFDTFVESSWYYARYVCHDSNDMLDVRAKSFLPVDCYIGGIEHANMHFLYARLFYRLMNSLDLVKKGEPFTKVITQGMILHQGSKMSKSKGNVVSPKSITEQYGVDALRMFILMAAPIAKDFEWKESGVVGTSRFLEKLYKFSQSIIPIYLAEKEKLKPIVFQEFLNKNSDISNSFKSILKIRNAAISNLHKDKFNTYISYCMKFANSLYLMAKERIECFVMLQELLKILHPAAPHLSHYLWWNIFQTDISHENFPKVIEIFSHTYNLAVQINNKMSGYVEVSDDMNQEQIIKIIMDSPLKERLDGFNILKVFWKHRRFFNIILN